MSDSGPLWMSCAGRSLGRLGTIPHFMMLWTNGASHLDTASPALRDDTVDSMPQAVCLLSEGGMLVYPQHLIPVGSQGQTDL
jgi:hypothetical protein